MTVIGDARRLPFADGVAQMCVTSPPYYNLRNYNIAGQIGLEQTPAEYVAELVATFREVRRVLRPDDGTLWLNIADSYASKPYEPWGIKAKDEMDIPFHLKDALKRDGWYARATVIWHKPNPMPESVTDRPTKAHEYVFLLAKSARYFYDANAVAEEALQPTGSPKETGQIKARILGQQGGTLGTNYGRGTRNARTVWTIATRPYSGAHFATMPPALAERCILAGTSQKGACPKCGAAWVRVVDKTSFVPWSERKNNGAGSGSLERGYNENHGKGMSHTLGAASVTTGWRPACDCNAGEPVPCVVLDPFSGSGTTERVAIGLGRRFIGTELNPAYIGLRSERVAAVQVRGL